MQDNRALQKNYEPELINVTRNPYLLDYEEQRRQTAQRQRAGQSARRASAGQTYRQEMRQPVRREGASRSAYGQEMRQPVSREGASRSAYGQEMRQPVRREGASRSAYRQDTRQPVRREGVSRSAYRQDTRQPGRRTGELQPISGQNMRQGTGRPGVRGGQQSREAAMRARRKRQQRRQKIAVSIWAICIIAISSVLFLNRNSASAAGPVNTPKDTQQQQHQEVPPATVSGAMIQGLPAEKFTAHPEWTENFLTPNEYSRPGEPLPEVKDVFVHYTANPGTSAAQNRSYFEQQKDVHMASVSAHFIIGYEGEIIQCVPLDEIAYAVAGRNYDSVSIECCYTAQDGSFTKETYNSLISLLAWLTDVYDLDTSHILRHYDCGGKKCPIYYTENEDKWEQLKQDVKAYK